MKSDTTTMTLCFIFGFCLNASAWRINQDKTDDLAYPLAITIYCLAALIVRAIMSKTENQTP